MEDVLKKMNTKLEDVVQYSLNIHNKNHHMNNYIGRFIKIEWEIGIP